MNATQATVVELSSSSAAGSEEVFRWVYIPEDQSQLVIRSVLICTPPGQALIDLFLSSGLRPIFNPTMVRDSTVIRVSYDEQVWDVRYYNSGLTEGITGSSEDKDQLSHKSQNLLIKL